MNKRDKVRAQVKSRFYYMFWGTATVSVVAGQIYLGTSYRAMGRSMDRWFNETVDLIHRPLRRNSGPQYEGPEGFYAPVPKPEDYMSDKAYPVT